MHLIVEERLAKLICSTPKDKRSSLAEGGHPGETQTHNRKDTQLPLPARYITLQSRVTKFCAHLSPSVKYLVPQQGSDLLRVGLDGRILLAHQRLGGHTSGPLHHVWSALLPHRALLRRGAHIESRARPDLCGLSLDKAICAPKNSSHTKCT